VKKITDENIYSLERFFRDFSRNLFGLQLLNNWSGGNIPPYGKKERRNEGTRVKEDEEPGGKRKEKMGGNENIVFLRRWAS